MKRYQTKAAEITATIFMGCLLLILVYTIVVVSVNESKKPDKCTPSQEHQEVMQKLDLIINKIPQTTE